MSHPLPQSVISFIEALMITNFLGFVTISVIVAFYMIVNFIKKKKHTNICILFISCLYDQKLNTSQLLPVLG